MKFSATFACSAVLLGLLATSSRAALIEDDFETDSSADYTVVNSNDPSPAGTVTFGFDYVAAGIPLAPRSTAGDTGGLKFTANDSAEVADVYTAFHNTALPANVKLTVDMYMGVEGFGGTTEYGHIGVGGDGSTVNSIFASGTGNVMAIDGDGDVTSDYRWSRPDGMGGRDIVNGVAPDPSYLAGGSNNTFQLYQDLFPGGAPTAGSPGNLWTTVEIIVYDGQTRVSLDGTAIILGPSIAGGGSLPAGQASIGYGDVFTSLANPFQSQFGIFDNLTVEEAFSIPEPSSIALLLVSSCAVALRRIR